MLKWLKQTLMAWGRGLVLFVVGLGLVWFGQGVVVQAQPSPPKPALLKQATEGSPPQAMTDAEKAQLKDPLFQLVLKDHADAKTLTAINQFLKPASQDVFVVDERIVDTAPKVGGVPAERRAAIAFSGTTNQLPLDQNVLFSVAFNSEQFPSASFIEAMGWDDSQSRFNYYKLEKVANEATPTWKFRGSSKDADLLSGANRQGTCLQCHINGGPVMKELFLPWNHWDSFSAKTPYLLKGNTSWPVAKAANSPLNNLKGAEDFETGTILPAITRFNERRINALKSADGQTITDARRLLKPLFTTTEFNLISSDSLSPLHPFSRPSTPPADAKITVPSSFFLNSRLMTETLGISANFSDFAAIGVNDYAHLVRQTKTTLNGQQPGDTNFAWFVPESSFMDDDFVRQLVQNNIVPASFVAAALAVDLENPVLSSDRSKLLDPKIIPTQFKIGANNDLIAQVVKNLEALNPATGTPEAAFLQLLRSPGTAVNTLQTRVNQYVSRESQRLSSTATPQARSQEWIRLYKLALKSREAILSDATLKSLDETGGRLLFARGDSNATVAPLPSAGTPGGNPQPPQTTLPTLKRGDTGNAVLFLQQRLLALGLFSDTPNSTFGPKTQTAVIAAQKRFQIKADGIVGPSTWAALTPPRVTLRLGSKGPEVVFLQQRLLALGGFNGTADGDFGPKTQTAVIAAQKRFQLPADGIVGATTWAALQP